MQGRQWWWRWWRPPRYAPISTYYGNTTFCDAVQLSQNHPHPQLPPHRPHGLRTATGAQVRVFFCHPLPFIHSFIHQKEHTLTTRSAATRRDLVGRDGRNLKGRVTSFGYYKFHVTSQARDIPITLLSNDDLSNVCIRNAQWSYTIIAQLKMYICRHSCKNKLRLNQRDRSLLTSTHVYQDRL
jgi:hypothetical protein